MKVAIASDHRGPLYKEKIINYLNSKGIEIIDCSKENTPTDDYPDFAFKVCNEVIKGHANFGILVCRSGIGMSIAANKVKGIRCAKLDSVEDAKLCKNDNGANVITFNYTKEMQEIEKIIEAYIEAEELIDERHKRRVEKIIKYENGEYNEL